MEKVVLDIGRCVAGSDQRDGPDVRLKIQGHHFVLTLPPEIFGLIRISILASEEKLNEDSTQFLLCRFDGYVFSSSS
jgi:hypothetical protein